MSASFISLFLIKILKKEFLNDKAKQEIEKINSFLRSQDEPYYIDEILNLYELARNQVSNVFEHATLKPKLKTQSDVMSSIVGYKTNKVLPRTPISNERKTSFKNFR